MAIEQSMNDLPVDWMNQIVNISENLADDDMESSLLYLNNEKMKAQESEQWFRCAFIRDVEFRILTDKTVGCAPGN